MSIGTADLLKAVKALWEAAGLDAEFQAFWPAGTTGEVVLEDEQAKPGRAWPYCVLEVPEPRVTSRMSGDAARNWALRDYVLRFTVHADKSTADSRSAKEVAAHLAERVMAAFGGHPTELPRELELDNGGVPLVQHTSDYFVRDENYRVRWVITYRVQADVPVAA